MITRTSRRQRAGVALLMTAVLTMTACTAGSGPSHGPDDMPVGTRTAPLDPSTLELPHDLVADATMIGGSDLVIDSEAIYLRPAQAGPAFLDEIRTSVPDDQLALTLLLDRLGVGVVEPNGAVPYRGIAAAATSGLALTSGEVVALQELESEGAGTISLADVVDALIVSMPADSITGDELGTLLLTGLADAQRTSDDADEDRSLLAWTITDGIAVVSPSDPEDRSGLGPDGTAFEMHPAASDPADIGLSPLQASLLAARFAADLHIAASSSAAVPTSTEVGGPSGPARSTPVSGDATSRSNRGSGPEHGSAQRAATSAVGSPCSVGGVQSLIVDAGALGTTSLFADLLLPALVRGGVAGSRAYEAALPGIGAALTLMKMIAITASFEMTLSPDPPATLDRTSGMDRPGSAGSSTGTVRFDAGPGAWANCMRLVIAQVGLDFDLPVKGPVTNTLVTWDVEAGEHLVGFCPDRRCGGASAGSIETRTDGDGSVVVAYQGLPQRQMVQTQQRVDEWARLDATVNLKDAGYNGWQWMVDGLGIASSALSRSVAVSTVTVIVSVAAALASRYSLGTEQWLPVRDWGAGLTVEITVDALSNTIWSKHSPAGDCLVVPSTTSGSQTAIIETRQPFVTGATGVNSSVRFTEPASPSSGAPAFKDELEFDVRATIRREHDSIEAWSRQPYSSSGCVDPCAVDEPGCVPIPPTCQQEGELPVRITVTGTTLALRALVPQPPNEGFYPRDFESLMACPWAGFGWPYSPTDDQPTITRADLTPLLRGETVAISGTGRTSGSDPREQWTTDVTWTVTLTPRATSDP